MTREKLARTGSHATYEKSCLGLADEEIARRVKAGVKHVIRMNVMLVFSLVLDSLTDAFLHDGTVPARTTPGDIVFGPPKDAHASLPTDQVLLKLDLFPTYHLASVVCDREMGITHVIRWEVGFASPSN